MRICFVTTGDVESLATMKRATGMAQCLHAGGHPVGIIAWDTPNNRSRFLLESPEAEILWITANQKAGSELAEKKRLLREWKPDVVYICAFGLRNAITRFNLKNAKILIEHSELASGIPRSFISKCKELLFEFGSVIACDGLLCASRYLEGHFGRVKVRLGRKRLPLLYHPYAYNQHLSSALPDAESRIAEIKGDKKMVFYMGTLAKNYGIVDMLKGIKKLSYARQDFMFHVAGRGRHAEIAKEEAENLGVMDFVSFNGYVPECDIGTWLSLADVFLAPIYDTVQDKARCPSKVYMYIPYCKPVVTSKIGDPFELLGEDGFYFEPGDADDMADVLNRALDTELRYMHVVPENHTWEARTSQFIEWCRTNNWFV